MENLIKKEKTFFSLLKNNLNNDYIRIDKTYVPKNQSNQLNRFYSKEDSFWFARLKVKDTKIIYYFGLNNGGGELYKPNLVLNFNAESALSSIKFVKDKVAILAKSENNDDSNIKKLSRSFKISKTKDYYYFILGEINSYDVINNIKLFMEIVDYETNFDSNYVIIKNQFVHDDYFNLHSELYDLKINIEVLNIIEHMKKISFNQLFIDEIINYLFILDNNKNYSLNQKIFSNKLPFNSYFSFIYEYLKNSEKYLKLDDTDAISLFKEDFKRELNNFDSIFLNKSIR